MWAWETTQTFLRLLRTDDSMLMFNFHRTMIAAVSMLGLTLPASATPPDIIDVRDEIFGISQTQVLLLRTTFDNPGPHIAGRNDVLLVSVDIATGERTLWPVYRIYRGPDPQSDWLRSRTGVF